MLKKLLDLVRGKKKILITPPQSVKSRVKERAAAIMKDQMAKGLHKIPEKAPDEIKILIMMQYQLAATLDAMMEEHQRTEDWIRG